MDQGKFKLSKILIYLAIPLILNYAVVIYSAGPGLKQSNKLVEKRITRELLRVDTAIQKQKENLQEEQFSQRVLLDISKQVIVKELGKGHPCYSERIWVGQKGYSNHTFKFLFPIQVLLCPVQHMQKENGKYEIWARIEEDLIKSLFLATSPLNRQGDRIVLFIMNGKPAKVICMDKNEFGNFSKGSHKIDAGQ